MCSLFGNGELKYRRFERGKGAFSCLGEATTKVGC